MVRLVLQPAKEAIMNALRVTVIELVKEAKKSGSEERLVNESLRLLLEKLKKVSAKQEYEIQGKVSGLFREFCGFFMACLVILRSDQEIDGIGGMEKAFNSREEESYVKFLSNVLSPLCMQANKDAIEITVFFLRSHSDEIVKSAKEVLIRAGQNPQGKSIVVDALRHAVFVNKNSLSVLAEVDAEIANAHAVEIVKSEDELMRHEALRVLAKTALSKDICDKMVEHLKGAKSKVLWEDSDHHLVIIDFIKNAFAGGLLAEVDAKILVVKAFKYNVFERGLAKLLLVARSIDPKDEEMIFEGFLLMGAKKSSALSVCAKTVKEFILSLNDPKRIEFLQRALLVSNDKNFAWLAGQHLVAIDVTAAVETFVACAKETGASKEKIGTMVQLAMKLCNDEKNSDNWIVDELNHAPKSRFAPVAKAILAYAETSECPTHLRLAIAFQPAMFGGNFECCRTANSILEVILLDENASSAQVLEALQALLNCRVQKKKLVSNVDAILRKAYESDCKERFLDQLLEIMKNDIRGYPMEPLFRPAVSFVQSMKADDAIPMLQKALNAKLPNGDLGLGARALYISALAKFALKGEIDAVVAIAGYRGGNICSEVIPKTLADIYRESSSVEIKKAVTEGVAERFLFSITKETDTRVFYLYELVTVEALKNEPLVQDAFLKGLCAIGNTSTRRSRGMCRVIERAFDMMPKKKKTVQGVLKMLTDKLSETRKLCAVKYGHQDEYVKDIDELLAEIGMTMMNNA